MSRRVKAQISYGIHTQPTQVSSSIDELSAPLRSSLSGEKETIWVMECQTAFENLKEQAANIVERRNFDTHRDIRRVCDDSQNGPSRHLT